jgi:tRNA U55 pseudouridine synthase TruB
MIIPEWELPLTPFSAKKKNWKKLYELARKWEKIIENKIMKINWYEILNYSFPTLELKLDVWSGTYIRSIWYWLWQQFWLWWILTELRRISIDNYTIDNINLNQNATFFIKKDWEDKWEIVFNYWILENDNINDSLNGKK